MWYEAIFTNYRCYKKSDFTFGYITYFPLLIQRQKNTNEPIITTSPLILSAMNPETVVNLNICLSRIVQHGRFGNLIEPEISI